MSRTRIINGKYTKIIKGDYRMFSEGNIASSAGKKYFEKGEDGGVILEDPKIYEPWKSFPRYDWYHCLFGSTVNKSVPITDLGITNTNVQMCLTGITSIIRFEGYDLDSKDDYKYHNWIYVMNIFMNNRGELVEGSMDLITYKTDSLVGSTERSVEKPEGSDKIVFQKTNFKLKSKGKELHDEVFLDHKLIFSNGMERALNFDNKTTESDIFYDLFSYAVREASIFNRRSDVSYVFAGTESAESFLSSFNETADKLSLDVDSPLMANAFEKYKGANLFKEIFGFVSYFTGLADDAPVLYERLKKIRGPVQLTETQCARMNPEGKFDKFKDKGIYFVTNEFEVLGEVLQKTKKKLKRKDE